MKTDSFKRFIINISGLVNLFLIISLLLFFIASRYIARFILKDSRITHAGGVVIKTSNNQQKVLLVTAKNCPFIWVLPKGHIKKAEKETHAALREVEEESGIRTLIISKIGNAERLLWNYKKQTTVFYLMQFEATVSDNRENRKIAWLPVDSAIKKLFYHSQKHILKQLNNESS